MTKRCFILGAGPSKKLLGDYRPPMFCISPNMHYPHANLIFTMDDPMIKSILEGPPGFADQLVFTTQQKYKYYMDNPRINKFSHLKFFDCQTSFSSGGNAIGIATVLGFDEVYLLGMDWTDNTLAPNVGKNYIECFYAIKNPENKKNNTKYIKIDKEFCDPQPWFDKIITIDEFKEII